MISANIDVRALQREVVMISRKFSIICIILLAAILYVWSSLTLKANNIGNIEEKQNKKRAKKMKVESPAFKNGQKIPTKYTADGEDISPPIVWSNIPEGTVEFALICDDPDAPTAEPWVHWVIYKIGPNIHALPENIPKVARVESPIKALQGRNSWTYIGYNGPAPPPGSGIHHYRFTVYALDTQLDIEDSATKKELLEAMEGHIIGKGTLVGTYKR